MSIYKPPDAATIISLIDQLQTHIYALSANRYLLTICHYLHAADIVTDTINNLQDVRASLVKDLRELQDQERQP